jgi:hypothetical protein
MLRLLTRILRAATSSISSPICAYWTSTQKGQAGKEVAKVDPEREPDRAMRAWESYSARAKWMNSL